MKLMTVWNAYVISGKQIDAMKAQSRMLYDNYQISEANEYSKRWARRKSQMRKFEEYITERIEIHDDLYEWAIREIDDWEQVEELDTLLMMETRNNVDLL